uniref:Putative secreted protein n=1 Tax=Anopheles marajoara TaxID=58244 RepID=A0A2M4C7S3_9DIPT
MPKGFSYFLAHQMLFTFLWVEDASFAEGTFCRLIPGGLIFAALLHAAGSNLLRKKKSWLENSVAILNFTSATTLQMPCCHANNNRHLESARQILESFHLFIPRHHSRPCR